MVNKMDDVYRTFTSNLCDIAVITESWLSSRVTDQLISILVTRQFGETDQMINGAVGCAVLSAHILSGYVI